MFGAAYMSEESRKGHGVIPSEGEELTGSAGHVGDATKSRENDHDRCQAGSRRYRLVPT